MSGLAETHLRASQHNPSQMSGHETRQVLTVGLRRSFLPENQAVSYMRTCCTCSTCIGGVLGAHQLPSCQARCRSFPVCLAFDVKAHVLEANAMCPRLVTTCLQLCMQHYIATQSPWHHAACSRASSVTRKPCWTLLPCDMISNQRV